MASGPSLAPELFSVIGSRPGISPALSQVMVPPAWRSVRAAVVGAAVTLVMPPAGAALTFLPPAAGATEFFLVVAVVLFLVVDGVAAPVLGVVSPGAAVVSLVSAVVDVVASSCVVVVV